MRSPNIKRLAFVTCGGGGVIDAVCRVQQRGVWPFEVAGVVTDRPCGAEKVATDHHLQLQSLHGCTGQPFTVLATDAVQRWHADCVVLLFLRQVGPELWRDSNATVWNLHPSLLPAYPGIGALERNYRDAHRAQRNSRTVRMGATIHMVNDELDGGPIISQRWFSIDDAPSLLHANHWCYLYKVALILEALCKLIDDTLPNADDDNVNWIERYTPWEPCEPITDVMLSLAQPWAVRKIGGRARELTL